MKKIQNRMEAIKNKEKLSEVFIGAVTLNFLRGMFSKIVLAVSIPKSIQTPYIKKRKSSGITKL